MSGKVCIVTGANTGIGKVTAHELAAAGAEVVLMCRSREKTEPVVSEIREATGNSAVSFQPLDLADLDSVDAAAAAWLATDRPIHVLVNNAGLAGHQGVTKQGLEIQFGVNHLGHFRLTTRLLERLKQSGGARVVNVASNAHQRVNAIDYDAIQKPTATTTGFKEYQVSKLANVLFSMALAKRLEGTDATTYALHPGVVASDVWRRVPWPFRSIMKAFMITNEEGAKTTLYCATSEAAAAETGLYYEKCAVARANRAATAAAAEELWVKSEEFVRSRSNPS